MNYSEEEKAMWLEDWRQSGKKAWTYAKENGIIPQTFCTWARKEAGGKTGFVEVQAPAIAGQLQRAEILIEKREVKIHISFSMSGAELRTVMDGLGSWL